MTWNYRVVRKSIDYKEHTDDVYEIYEIYYDDDGAITCYTENSIAPMGLDLSELRGDLKHMVEALDKPVLEMKDLLKLSEETLDE